MGQKIPEPPKNVYRITAKCSRTGSFIHYAYTVLQTGKRRSKLRTVTLGPSLKVVGKLPIFAGVNGPLACCVAFCREGAFEN